MEIQRLDEELDQALTREQVMRARNGHESTPPVSQLTPAEDAGVSECTTPAPSCVVCDGVIPPARVRVRAKTCSERCARRHRTDKRKAPDAKPVVAKGGSTVRRRNIANVATLSGPVHRERWLDVVVRLVAAGLTVDIELDGVSIHARG